MSLIRIGQTCTFNIGDFVITDAINTSKSNKICNKDCDIFMPTNEKKEGTIYFNNGSTFNWRRLWVFNHNNQLYLKYQYFVNVYDQTEMSRHYKIQNITIC